MDHVKFALRLLVALFFITLLVFWLEAAWDLSHAARALHDRVQVDQW